MALNTWVLTDGNVTRKVKYDKIGSLLDRSSGSTSSLVSDFADPYRLALFTTVWIEGNYSASVNYVSRIKKSSTIIYSKANMNSKNRLHKNY